MDDETLKSLTAALAATPDNAQLLAVVLDALLERGEAERAAALLAGRTPEELSEPAHRCSAARVCLAAQHYARAREFVSGLEQPEALLLMARALLGLDEQQQGREAYEAAIAANAALEDAELAAQLASKSREVESNGGVVRLRVVANDDTSATEVDRLLAPEAQRVDFSAVGGLESIKKQIEKRIILPFQKPSLFRKFRKRVGGGILMYGPPGCGKTLLARATAGECHARFLNVAISDVLDMYIGESEHKLHALFDKARQDTPSVLFFDEIEALGGKRQFTREATSSKLVSQFLSEMDGFARNNQGVLVLGATNVPWAVDPAFRRPGRFDRVLFVPPPDREARKRILELSLAERPHSSGLELDKVARRCQGFSGADLANLVETAADAAIDASLHSGEEVPIQNGHLLDALAEVKPTTVEWLTTARNYARYANEAGQYDEVLDFLRRHGKGG